MNRDVTYQIAQIRKQFSEPTERSLQNIEDALKTLEYINANVNSYQSFSFNLYANEKLHEIVAEHFPNDGEYGIMLNTFCI